MYKEEETYQEQEADKLLKESIEKQETLQAINQYVDEDDMGEISLKSILGGDILGSSFFIKQVIFVMFCVALTLLYTANRYSSQQDAILIDSLRVQLQKEKYNVMTQSSELMNFTRQSNIEKLLRQTNDSTLRNPITPPYLIKLDGQETVPMSIIEEEEDEEEPTV